MDTLGETRFEQWSVRALVVKQIVQCQFPLQACARLCPSARVAVQEVIATVDAQHHALWAFKCAVGNISLDCKKGTCERVCCSSTGQMRAEELPILGHRMHKAVKFGLEANHEVKQPSWESTWVEGNRRRPELALACIEHEAV